MGTRTLGTAAIAAIIAFTLIGCSGGESAAPDSGTSGSDAAAPSESATEPESNDQAGADPILVSEAPAGSPTIAISAEAMDPSSVDIAVGSVVEFVSGDGSFHGLLVGSLASVTVASSLPEFYRFDAPGTYTASDELGGGTATITVK